MKLLVTALTAWLLTKKLIVEPRRFLENKSTLHILRGPGSPVEVAFDKEVLFSLQKVKKILEITPITSVCGPRRYSQAALADILGSTSSKRQAVFQHLFSGRNSYSWRTSVDENFVLYSLSLKRLLMVT